MADVVRYLCRVRLHGAERVVLWEASGGGVDRVVLDDAGEVVSYPSQAAARRADASISAEPAPLYDLDAIWSWCVSADLAVDCSTILDTWNFLGDLPRSQDLFAAADSRADALYDKLFYGCNLPAMGASPGEYVPSWSSSEVAALKRLLALGVNDFLSRCPRCSAVEHDAGAEGASPRD
jgi:hypothetical protein